MQAWQRAMACGVVGQQGRAGQAVWRVQFLAGCPLRLLLMLCFSLCAEQEIFYGKEIIVADREMVEMVGGWVGPAALMHWNAVHCSAMPPFEGI